MQILVLSHVKMVLGVLFFFNVRHYDSETKNYRRERKKKKKEYVPHKKEIPPAHSQPLAATAHVITSLSPSNHVRKLTN
jgi:hypothetical protein